MNYRTTTLLGAVLATSLIAIPCAKAHAASHDSSNSIAYQQLAQDEDQTIKERTDKKVDEMQDMGTGAAREVKRAHREHEETESMHHGLRDKTDAKMGEIHDEAVGAGNAVQQRHEEHERYEEHEHSNTQD